MKKAPIVTIRNAEILSEIASALQSHGQVRVIHLGTFKVMEVKNRKYFDFKKRKMVDMPGTYKQVSFKPSESLRDFVNGRSKT